MNEKFIPEGARVSEREKTARRFSKSSDTFDPELFMEGYDALALEYDRADPVRRRDILMGRYFDTFEPIDDTRIERSEFEDRFIVRPPKSIADHEDGVREEHVTTFLKDPSRRFTGYDPGSVTHYGPSRIFDLPPGNFIETERLGPQDVVGTTALSSCTAIVGQNDRGLFMCHVRNSNRDILRSVLERMAASGYPRENTRLFAPFRIDSNGKEAPAWNEPIQDLANEFGTRIDWFPYVGYETYNPDDIRHTTLLIGRDTLRSVGTSFVRQPIKVGRGETYVKRTIIRPNTVRDFT